ncbi:MAG TPA: FAD-dependent thymidylate synthase [Candidatus Paceibacterota bacterium]|nr:FAD-dependent thymidylate synthase [Candidatus Paceibacterota bacterium]
MNNDPLKHLRKRLFRSVEPKVELVAITRPVGRFKKLCTTETLPGFTARTSHESKGTQKDDLRLNRDLIKKNHHTPLESICLTFLVRGITKSLQNQWVRHRIGVGWTYRSTRFVPANKNKFVYCTYDYIENEKKVQKLYAIDERHAKRAIKDYDRKRELGATKQDSRKIMPVFWDTPCYFYCNVRSLRYMFGLRLAKDAEWEIRRMSKMMYKIVMREIPSLFVDMKELYKTEKKSIVISKEELKKLAQKMLSVEELKELIGLK